MINVDPSQNNIKKAPFGTSVEFYKSGHHHDDHDLGKKEVHLPKVHNRHGDLNMSADDAENHDHFDEHTDDPHQPRM